MKYKLIISDFDGTFRHRDTSIGERTLSAVKEYVSRGGIFVMCTGRMPSSIRPILVNAGMGGVFVAYQGSLVADVATGNSINEKGFTKEQTLRICRTMQDMGLRIHLYDRDNCYVNYDDKDLWLYEDICAIKSVHIDDPYEYARSSSAKFFKVLAMVKKEERNIVRDALRAVLGEKEFYISCSASTLCEVTAIEDTKAAAVEFLSEYYHVDRSEVLAFGDNQNDAPMLEAAGHGVAVANSDPFLKEIADEVYAKTCDEDAVGEYIYEHILNA